MFFLSLNIFFSVMANICFWVTDQVGLGWGFVGLQAAALLATYLTEGEL